MVHHVHHVHGDISIVERNAVEIVVSVHRYRYHHRPDTERLRDFSGVSYTRSVQRADPPVLQGWCGGWVFVAVCCGVSTLGQGGYALCIIFRKQFI